MCSFFNTLLSKEILKDEAKESELDDVTTALYLDFLFDYEPSTEKSKAEIKDELRMLVSRKIKRDNKLRYLEMPSKSPVRAKRGKQLIGIKAPCYIVASLFLGLGAWKFIELLQLALNEFGF